MKNKDNSINTFLDFLKKYIPEEDWNIIDYWGADKCAIGIQGKLNPDRIVYCSTYNKKNGYIDYECEIAFGQTTEESSGYNVVSKDSDIKIEDTIEIIRRHLLLN